MSLTTELLKVLDSSEEPLTKRLKVANNAFKSSDLPIHHREAFLINWILKATKSNDSEVWNLMYMWLISDQIKNLGRSDFNQDDLIHLTEVINKRLKHIENLSSDTKVLIVKTAIAVIGNSLFLQLFRCENYCTYISNILKKVHDADLILLLLQHEDLFPKIVTSSEDFPLYFCKYNVPTLSDVAVRFDSNDLIFQEISKITQKCLFHRNFKSFNDFYEYIFSDKTDNAIHGTPQILCNNFKNLYNLDTDQVRMSYKILFNSYYNSNSNHFEEIYKFLIIIMESLGFDISSYFQSDKLMKFKNKSAVFNKSVTALGAILEVLSIKSSVLDCKVNEITFSDLLQNLLNSVMSVTVHANKDSFLILNHILAIDPLIAEKNISKILTFIMLSDIKQFKVEYEACLTRIFEIFSKLHRIEKLISKMIPTLKQALEGNGDIEEAKLVFLGECVKVEQNIDYDEHAILPQGVLSYFTQCITTLASWQIMNLFKTFVYHLEVVVSEQLQNIVEDKVQLLYVDILSILMCQFLSSVRIAEHTVPTLVVSKFVQSMDKLKEILAKFGSALVNMEHNILLMRAYLNICYIWGELYITISHYSINNEVVIKKVIDSDYSACNITYLHPYLTREQWCLFSERINNFGEKPCKKIMQKLFLQKVKAMLLFEDDVSEEVFASTVKSYSFSLDDIWEELSIEPFVINEIIPRMEISYIVTLAEHLLKDAIDQKNLDFMCKVNSLDNMKLRLCVLFVTLSKINRMFKVKRKHNETNVKKMLCTTLFPNIQENDFLQNNGQETTTIVLEIFSSEVVRFIKVMQKNKSVKELQVNEEKLLQYLDVICTIPVIYTAPNIQTIVFTYILTVLIDLKQNYIINDDVLNKCERILTGLSQHNCYVVSHTTLCAIFKAVLCYTENYANIFINIMDNILKKEAKLEDFTLVIDSLVNNLNNEKYLKCVLQLLKSINKFKKSKMGDYKSLVVYLNAICDKLLNMLTEDQPAKSNVVIEAYALLLKHYLAKDSEEEHLNKLLLFLPAYIESAAQTCLIENEVCQGVLILFVTVMRNKLKLKMVEDDFVLKAWTVCQLHNISDKESEEYSRLVVLVFEHIPNDEFTKISNNLFEVTMSALKENKFDEFAKYLEIWNAIVGSNFNPAKTKLWQEVLVKLLQKVVFYLVDCKNSENSNLYGAIIHFETTIINTTQLLLTSTMVDLFFVTVSTILKDNSNFLSNFTLVITLMEAILKHRKSLVVDRLPSYLQQYRTLLKQLCQQSNSDLKLKISEMQDMANCAHHLQKVTKQLITCGKHMARISPYLIADIINQYEQITLYPSVKIHLQNCIYSLLSLCDEYAISYLMRVLSVASTEIFKISYDNYKKYYRFTGKI